MMLAFALCVLLLLATLGEGGGSPGILALWHALLVVIVAVAVLAPDRSAAPSRIPGAVRVPFAVFLVSVGVGALRAPYAYAAWLQILEVAAFVAVALLAARVGRQLLSFLVVPLALCAAVQGCYALLQWWADPDVRPAGTFLNPNHMALWLVAVILFVLGAATSTAKRSVRIAAWALPPALAAVVLSGSRGAFLGLLAGGAWWIVARWSTFSRRFRIVVVSASAVLVLLLGVRQLDRLLEFDPFRYQRIAIWRASARAWLADPLWGTGPGQFKGVAPNLQFPDGDGPLRYDRQFSMTHSDLVRLPVELGTPAALALFAALLAAARSLRRRRGEGSLPETADGAMSALVAVAAQALFDNPSSWSSIYVLVAALAGSLVAETRGAVIRLRGVALPLAASAAVVVVYLAGDLSPYLAWREVRDLPRGRLSAADHRRLERAIARNPLDSDYHERSAEALMVDVGGWGLEAYGAARESAEQAIRLNPEASRPRKTLARLCARACRTLPGERGCRERVRESYESAAARARHDPSIPIELAGFLIDTGDLPGARRAAERALQIEPESALPRLLLADIHADTGSPSDLSRARELLEEARRKSAIWANWTDRPYGRQLLVIDPAIDARIDSKIEAAGALADP